MDNRRRVGTGVAITFALFLAIQLAALALVGPFERGGYQPVENPQDPTNSVIYVVAILVATGFILLAFKYDVEGLIRALVIFSGAWISFYVFDVALPAVDVGGANALALGLAGLLGLALYVHPEWYVIDAAGAIMGGGAAGLFGISFGILPALVLLVVLAIYDAISVYGTEHMLTLASGVLDLKVPVVLVIPLSASYSFLDDGAPDPTEEGEGSANDEGETSEGERERDDEEDATVDGNERDDEGTTDGNGRDAASEGPLDRDAMFVGLGDAVIPTVLVASAAFFAPEGIPRIFDLPVPAATAMVGTFAGLAVLLWMVMKGRAHAGLPLLNGGTIAGYLLGALASGLSLVAALGLGPYL